MEQESFRFHLLPLDNRKLKFKASKAILWARFTFRIQGTLSPQSGESNRSKIVSRGRENRQPSRLCRTLNLLTNSAYFLSLGLQMMIHKMGLIPTSRVKCHVACLTTGRIQCVIKTAAIAARLFGLHQKNLSGSDLRGRAVLCKLQHTGESPGDLV